MFGWKKRRQARQEEENQIQKNRLALALQEMEEAKAEMFKKPCPMTDGGTCFEACVHFKDGHVDWLPSLAPGSPPFLLRLWPRCRLWE